MDAGFSIDVVDSYAVIEASDDQFFSDDVAAIYWDLVSSDFVLIPEQNELVFIAGQKNWVQDESHPYRFLVVAIVLHDNVQRISLNEQASGMVSDEYRGGLQVKKRHWLSPWFYCEVEDVGSWD